MSRKIPGVFGSKAWGQWRATSVERGKDNRLDGESLPLLRQRDKGKQKRGIYLTTARYMLYRAEVYARRARRIYLTEARQIRLR